MKFSNHAFTFMILIAAAAAAAYKSNDNVLDVAIVGAGTAGPYAGWRLLNDHKSKNEEMPRIEIFERQSHVGGRLYSPRIGCHEGEGDPRTAPRTELGGMRIRDIDKLVHGVCQQLGIELGPFYMNKDTPNLGPFDKEGNVLAAYDKQCKQQYGSDKSCAGDDPNAPIYLNGLFTDRATVNENMVAGNFYPSPNEYLLGQEDFHDAIPYVVYPWNSTSAVHSSTTGESFHAGSHPMRASDQGSRRRLAQEKADPCNIRNGEKFFGTAGKSPTQMTDNIPGYQQSMWALNSLNGVSEAEFSLNDAISGYSGKLGGTSPANRGVSDATFTPGANEDVPEQPTMSYTRPLLGMQEIPLTLERNFRSLGGQTNFNSQLLKVEKFGDMEYELTFRRTWTSPCNQVTSFQGPKASKAGEIYTIRAKKVLITLTKSALQRVIFVDYTGKSGLADKVLKLTNALESAPAMKYFASYDQRWWERKAQEHPSFPNNATFEVGRITSSALNNLFAWYPGTQQHKDTKRSCSDQPDMGVIQNYITGFADMTYAGVLNEEFQLQCKETEADQCGKCFNEDTGFIGAATNHAPKMLADAMRYQMATTYGFDPVTEMDRIPEPTEVRYQLWSNSNPVTQTDSCHYFKAGYKWWDLYAEARDLTGDGSLSLIGETMSYNWFWTEGAMETAEYVLQEIYGLDRPHWLSQQDYCWAMPYWPLPRSNDSDSGNSDSTSSHQYDETVNMATRGDGFAGFP